MCIIVFAIIDCSITITIIIRVTLMVFISASHYVDDRIILRAVGTLRFRAPRAFHKVYAYTAYTCDASADDAPHSEIPHEVQARDEEEVQESVP